jgi:glycosyltransferase involved in cell wall biosynthesis
MVLTDFGQASGFFTIEVAHGLSMSCDVHVVTTSRSAWLARLRQLPGVRLTVLDLQKSPKSLRTAQLVVRQICRSERPAFVLDIGLSIIGLAFSSSYDGIPLFVMAHDPEPHPDPRSRVLHRLDRLWWRRTQGLVALSEHSAGVLRTRSNRPIIVSRLGPLGAARHSTSMTSERARRRALLYFGRIAPYKGLHVLAEAFASAHTVLVDLTLTVAGDGPIEPGTRQLLELHGARIVQKWLDEEEIDGLFDHASICVLPYTSATQSGVVARSAARGVPCIVTNVGALAEQVEHGVSGLVVAPNDAAALSAAIVDLASAPDRLAAMGDAARRLNETENSWETIGAELAANVMAVVEATSQ